MYLSVYKGHRTERLDSTDVWHGSRFSAGGFEISLDDHETSELAHVLRQMGTWAEDVIIALEDRRDLIPGTDEEAGVLLGALEVLRRRGQSSPALRRLHYAIRQRQSPEPDSTSGR